MTSSDKNYVTVEDLIQITIQFEIDSAGLYKRMQATAGEDNVLEILRLLERQEREHERILRSYRINQDPAEILQFPPDITLSMPAVHNENPGMDELIKIALEREERSAAVYQHAADMASGELKDLLTGLAVFEREHVVRVKSLKNYY